MVATAWRTSREYALEALHISYTSCTKPTDLPKSYGYTAYLVRVTRVPNAFLSSKWKKQAASYKVQKKIAGRLRTVLSSVLREKKIPSTIHKQTRRHSTETRLRSAEDTQ